jgi:hypothetical protein
MKAVLVIVILAATAHAQVVDPYAEAQPAERPVVHVTDQTVAYAEPNATSKVVFVANANDDLHAGGVRGEHGEWTYVELAAGGGWIPTARLTPPPAPAPRTAAVETRPQPAAVTSATAQNTDTEEPKGPPVGKRFVSGFRLGWVHIMNYDQPREDRNMMSLKQQFDLKAPDMMVIGYEGFYRILGHSTLNVILIGNASVSGLDQSRFVPSLNGLLGVEIDRGFQLGVGVSLTPDPVAPSHMIVAAGWTPSVGSIQTPIHFVFVPDPDQNHRIGATIGMNW